MLAQPYIVRYRVDGGRCVTPAVGAGVLFQTVTARPKKKYFVTFRKWEDRQARPILVDVVVEASTRRQAREDAEKIARRELSGFRFVGVN